jgi:hypothetical protein
MAAAMASASASWRNEENQQKNGEMKIVIGIRQCRSESNNIEIMAASKIKWQSLGYRDNNEKNGIMANRGVENGGGESASAKAGSWRRRHGGGGSEWRGWRRRRQQRRNGGSGWHGSVAGVKAKMA